MYLSMFMNAGWLGRLVFAMLIVATVVAGAGDALPGGATQGLFLVAYAALVAHALKVLLSILITGTISRC